MRPLGAAFGNVAIRKGAESPVDLRDHPQCGDRPAMWRLGRPRADVCSSVTRFPWDVQEEVRNP